MWGAVVDGQADASLAALSTLRVGRMVNIAQLERIRRKLEEIKEIVEEDSQGTYNISGTLSEFESVVLNELQDLVWKKYEEERKKDGEAEVEQGGA